ncbi:MAG: hypothetical protein ACRDVE_18790, partial [Actinocrinis sp.]
TRWFNAYGVCADDAERAFKAVDRNGDGILSVDEVQKAIREFYLSDDPRAPGNLIFGPLPMKKAIEARIDGKPGHAGKARKAGAVAAKAVAGAVKK